MKLVIDIETLPTVRPEIIAEIRAAVKPPATYKKADSIEQWLIDNIDAETDAAVRKTALDGAFGRICCIGMSTQDQAAVAYSHADNERGLLEHFYCHLTGMIEPSDLFNTTVIGHNVSSFDLRFLVQRSIVHGIKPHPVIARAAQAKPWETEKVYDTMIQWAGVGGRISLDKLCKALSIPTSKGDLDGSKVWDYVKAGRLDEVEAYCVADVIATSAVYKKMIFE